jgi:hypothetical protein
MKKGLIIYCLLMGWAIKGQETYHEKYIIEDSEIHIAGTSNVTDYNCNLDDFSNNKNIQVETIRQGKLIELNNATIQLKALGFDCKNKPITKDFLEAIKSDEHPHVTIEFLELHLNQYVEESEIQKNVKALISIRMAGTTQKVIVYLERVAFDMNGVRFKGNKTLTMSSFRIEPPTALMGLVKAEDEVRIDFNVYFKLIQ